MGINQSSSHEVYFYVWGLRTISSLYSILSSRVVFQEVKGCEERSHLVSSWPLTLTLFFYLWLECLVHQHSFTHWLLYFIFHSTIGREEFLLTIHIHSLLIDNWYYCLFVYCYGGIIYGFVNLQICLLLEIIYFLVNIYR